MKIQDLSPKPLREFQKVSVKKLQSQASTANARVGMEMELVVKNGQRPKDLSASPSTDSMDEFVEFFRSSNSPKRFERLKRRLISAFVGWQKKMIRDYPGKYSRSNPPNNFHAFLKSRGVIRLKTGKVDWRFFINPWDPPYWAEDIQWPGVEQGGIENIAAEFQKVIGRPVKYSERYHGVKRDGNSYIVEPDSSIDYNNQYDEGLEFISPPLPLAEILKDLHKVRAWCKQRGNYTNTSTGLHMNISVPGFSRKQVDYLKLLLLSDDHEIQQQLRRLSNEYLANSLKMMKQKIRSIDTRSILTFKTFLEQVRKQLTAKADSVFREHNATVGLRGSGDNQWVEFRSPGGDWLNLDDKWIEKTLYNYVVAMNAAMDPDSHKQEYVKKLLNFLNISQISQELHQDLKNQARARNPKKIQELDTNSTESAGEPTVDEITQMLAQQVAQVFTDK